MSASLMQWAWTVDAPAKPKFLLTALAWMCQDGDPQKSGNVCWPGCETLMQRCGIRSKRSLYDHLSWLESKNLIWREMRDGRTLYFLNFGGSKPPAAQPTVSDAGPQPEVRELAQPQLGIPEPSAKIGAASAKLRSDSIEGKKRNKTLSQKTSPSESQKKVQRTAHRLPEEWTPGEAGHAFAESLGLDPQSTFDQFRDFWMASASPGARKLDWTAAWRYWCRRQTDMRPRNGASAARHDRVFGGFIDEGEVAAAEERLRAAGLYDVPQNQWGAGP